MSSPRFDRLEHNFFQNGAMEAWNRVGGNTTTINQAAPTTGYAADRIKYGTSGGVTVKNFSIVRGTTVPSATGFRYAFNYRINCLTAIAAPLAADVVNAFQYNMEGYDYAPLHGRYAVVGFWIHLTAPAGVFPLTLPIAFSNGSNRCYVTSFTVNANAVYQFIKVVIPMDAAGTWSFDSNLGLKITIASMSGTNFQGAPDVWQAGDLFAPSGVFNIMSNTGNILRITGLQMKVLGDQATSSALDQNEFVRYGITKAGEESALGRSYEKTYDPDDVPGTATFASVLRMATGPMTGNSTPGITWQFKHPKRTAPNVVPYSPRTLNAPNFAAVATSSNVDETTDTAASAIVSSVGVKQAFVRTNAAVAWQVMAFHATADCDF